MSSHGSAAAPAFIKNASRRRSAAYDLKSFGTSISNNVCPSVASYAVVSMARSTSASTTCRCVDTSVARTSRGVCHRFELQRAVVVARQPDALPPALLLSESRPPLSVFANRDQRFDVEAGELGGKGNVAESRVASIARSSYSSMTCGRSIQPTSSVSWGPPCRVLRRRSLAATDGAQQGLHRFGDGEAAFARPHEDGRDWRRDLAGGRAALAEALPSTPLSADAVGAVHRECVREGGGEAGRVSSPTVPRPATITPG